MSLLWPNQLMVSMNAHGYALVYRAGLTKRVLSRQYHEGNEERGALLTQLDYHLATMELKRNTQLRVTLSADFVRYLVLPAQPTLVFKTDREPYAKAVYREVYGAVVEHWAVQCSDTPPNQAILTCAIDQSILDGIKELATKYQLALRSLQPYLVATYNKIPIKNLSGYLVVVEPDRLLILKLVDGCNQIKTIKWSDDWQQTLAIALQREELLEESQSRDVMVYAPLAKGATISPIKHWNIKRIGTGVTEKTKEAISHPAYAMLEVLL